MNFELSGKLINIEKIEKISDNFQKREFVIEVESSPKNSWVDFIKFQLTQSRCDIIDPYSINDNITVSFNLRGRKWEKDGKVSYFTNLEAWKIQNIGKPISKTESKTNIENLNTNLKNDFPLELQNDGDTDELPF